ncbi:hypothetical protein [Massilia sp. Leaf139]|uniref:hypothetical protein n=1 Tax=Massilia sp. Leaf139 TaxID=1736272 RepID=UPI0006F47FB5|nr:hypothetical protein [Massilia sp. Leaf139]KQQ93651.1 hypothetical protein ASF77_22470 [Massilia sp. Leaf139]
MSAAEPVQPATTFEQTRALYGSDEQMARALFEQLTITRLDLELQSALRRRAEDKLQAPWHLNRRQTGEKKR